jgi:hypothetical protein
MKEEEASRRGAKAQRKTVGTRQRFSPVRLCVRNLLPATEMKRIQMKTRNPSYL